MLARFKFKVVSKTATLFAFLSILTLSGIISSTKVYSQTIEDLESRKARLELEASIAELEKNIEASKQGAAEARRSAAAAAFPDIDPSQAPSGTISATDVKFEPTLLSYRALEYVASDIKKEITNNLGSDLAIIIFDKDTVKSAALDKLVDRSFSDRIKEIKLNYANLQIRQTENPVVAAAAGFAFRLIPFFRVNRTFKEETITIDNRALVALIANKFKKDSDSNVSIYYPTEYPLISTEAVESVVNNITELQELIRISTNILVNNPNDSRKDKLILINQSVNTLIDDLLKVDEKSGLSPFENISRARTITKIASGKEIYNLSIKITSGGTNRTTQSFFSNRLRHSGGAIVEYIVYDSNLASVVLSNIHSSYTGFTKIPNVNIRDQSDE